MSTTTTRLGLYKPAADGSELVNVVTDLNNNMDSIDAKMGAFACTSGTRPGSPYNGQMIRETDTGKLMLWDSASWKQVLYNTAQFTNSIGLASGSQLNIGTSGAPDAISIKSAAGATFIFSSRVAAETTSRFTIDSEGKQEWGSGGAARDTNLYRSGANTLHTDDSLDVVGNLNVIGISGLGEVNVSGNLNLGSARYDTNLSSQTNLNNTVTETAIASMSIAANDPAVGAVYRIKAWGTATVTGTPTLTFRTNLSGTALIAFPAVTVRSGAVDGYWEVEVYIACVTTGVTGTFTGFAKYGHNFLTSVTTYTKVGPIVAASVTRDTTATIVLNLTAQWSAASASNSCFCRGFSAERVA
jgi:hypothetical protein